MPFSITPASSAPRPAFIVSTRAPVMTVVPVGLTACTVTPSAIPLVGGVMGLAVSPSALGAAAKKSLTCALCRLGPIDQNKVAPPLAQPR